MTKSESSLSTLKKSNKTKRKKNEKKIAFQTVKIKFHKKSSTVFNVLNTLNKHQNIPTKVILQMG